MRELKTFSMLIGSGFLSQALMFLGTLMLSRLYGPASFGELAYYTGFASLVAVVSGLRFDYVVFSRSDFDKLVFFAIALVCAGCIHLLIFMVLIGADVDGFDSYKTSYWLLFFSLSASLFYLGTQLLIAISEYAGFARLRLLQAVLQIVVGLLLYRLHPKFGLFLAYALSQMVVGVFVFFRYGRSVLEVNKAQATRCWKSCSRDATVNSLLVLMQYSTPFAPVLLGSLYFSGEEVGAYFLFSSAFAAPLSIYRRSAVHFLNGEVGSPLRAQMLAAEIKKRAPLVIGVLLVITVLGSLIFSLAAREVATLLFGASWAAHSYLLLPLFLFYFFDALFQPFTTLLPLWGHQAVAMKYEVLRFAFVFFVLPFIIVVLSLNFYDAIISYFLVMSLVYIANFCTVCHWTFRADLLKLT